MATTMVSIDDFSVDTISYISYGDIIVSVILEGTVNLITKRYICFLLGQSRT